MEIDDQFLRVFMLQNVTEVLWSTIIELGRTPEQAAREVEHVAELTDEGVMAMPGIDDVTKQRLAEIQTLFWSNVRSRLRHEG